MGMAPPLWENFLSRVLTSLALMEAVRAGGTGGGMFSSNEDASDVLELVLSLRTLRRVRVLFLSLLPDCLLLRVPPRVLLPPLIVRFRFLSEGVRGAGLPPGVGGAGFDRSGVMTTLLALTLFFFFCF